MSGFATEVAAFLDAEAPRSLWGTRKGKFDGFWGGNKAVDVDPDVLKWRDVMLARGWTAPMWPKAYGGGGYSLEDATIIEAALRERGLPPPVVGFGLTMIGPTLLDFGSDAQKQAYLPDIVGGNIRWCQGYSEPGAGSDLASLATKAQVDGDDFILDGQKIWTSYADESDWIFCLVRTNTEVKKQAGITFILVDMDTPGVTVRPISLISGASPFCEVFLEDVRVPRANVVHEIDKGWTVAKALLGYERSMIGEAVSGQMVGAEDELVHLAKANLPVNGDRIACGETRAAIAKNAMRERCFMLTIQRIAEAAAAGDKPGAESSVTKICGSEIKQQRWALAAQIAGEQGLGWSGEGFDEHELALTRSWLRSRGNTIEGGSSEIQLNIIAKRVLGLPDGPKRGR